MKRSWSYVTGLMLAALVSSCSKSNETDLVQTYFPPAGNTCDTTNMQFSADIKPILLANCYACHSNANFSFSGVKLEDYTDVKEQVDNGALLGTITHAAGYPPMPQGGPKLSGCNINKIRAWVEHGAENN